MPLINMRSRLLVPQTTAPSVTTKTIAVSLLWQPNLHLQPHHAPSMHRTTAYWNMWGVICVANLLPFSIAAAQTVHTSSL
jgi:hypothetical protein